MYSLFSLAEDLSLVILAYAAMVIAQLPVFADQSQWIMLATAFLCAQAVWQGVARPYLRRLFKQN